MEPDDVHVPDRTGGDKPRLFALANALARKTLDQRTRSEAGSSRGAATDRPAHHYATGHRSRQYRGRLFKLGIEAGKIPNIWVYV